MNIPDRKDWAIEVKKKMLELEISQRDIIEVLKKPPYKRSVSAQTMSRWLSGAIGYKSMQLIDDIVFNWDQPC